MDQPLSRKILLASIVELQETIAWEFWHGQAVTLDALLQLQRDRLVRLDYTGHGDSGTSKVDGGGC